MTPVEESLLLQKLRENSTREAAFGTLVSTYQERLYWHIRGMVMIHEDADDVLQNTFIKVFRHIDSFKGESKLYTWMYRIATNEALTHLKKSNRMIEQSIDKVDTVLNQRLKADPYFDSARAQDNLIEILSTLPQQQRIIFSMKYFQNLKLKEIAEALDLSLGGVKSSYHLAQKKIKNRLSHKTF